MARGSKEAYTDKQKRQAQHIEESEKEQGASEKTAARIGWATVNKQTGGGKKKSTTKTKSTTKKKPTTKKKSSTTKKSATKTKKKKSK